MVFEVSNVAWNSITGPRFINSLCSRILPNPNFIPRFPGHRLHVRRFRARRGMAAVRKIFRPANGHYVATRLAAPPFVGIKSNQFGLDRIHYCDLIYTVHLRVRLTVQSDIDGVYK